MEKCHICNNETDFECRDCELPVCDDCTMTYNQFTQIDWTQCTVCGGQHEQRRADEYFAEIEEDKAAEKKRKERNEKQREYYRSPQAVEKRKLKKLELQEERKKDNEERAKRLSGILSNIFKYM
ncbi:cell envelope integrity protein TolA [Chryseobacterium viscerum]|uniref:Cell envelope integrity protein TolA n=1 Tax=Chryseobacterium viscerum TaxID=1037377 RepID=A0A5N4BJ48_9FLAO|nr:cell envelope integrity protein TolA [Chryseobacterium viscerum]KAB1228472.1 cell envelope integrity protein TolA [Chryseobacterium viscerum]